MPSAILETMTCAICGEREAVVFMRRRGGNGSGDISLCEECARGRGLTVGRGRIELRFEDLLSIPSSDASARSMTCPCCGFSVEDLHAEGRLGCLDCADIFRPEIERYLRARSAGPFFVPDAAKGEADAAARTSGREAALRAALVREDYEEAAAIRDGLSKRAPAIAKPADACGSELFDDSPFVKHAFGTGGMSASAPDVDVVLETRARLCRNYRRESGPARRFASGEERRTLAAMAATLPGISVFALPVLDPAALASLVENGAVPRSFALDGAASLALSRSGPVAILLGAGDSLSVLSRIAGLDALRALRLVNSMAVPFATLGPFALDGEFGYVCEKLCDFGSGLSLEALVHLPALGQEGQSERALRGLLAHGLQVRGFYGSEDGSAGDLYEVSTDHAYGQAPSEMARDFRQALGRVVEAERRARASLAERKADEVLDRAGRGLGLLRNCRFVGAAEAAAALSALRLAALAGFLSRPEPAVLGSRLAALGPAAVRRDSPKAADDGRSARRGDERARARLLASLLEGGMIEEGGHRCSKD